MGQDAACCHLRHISQESTVPGFSGKLTCLEPSSPTSPITEQHVFLIVLHIYKIRLLKNTRFIYVVYTYMSNILHLIEGFFLPERGGCWFTHQDSPSGVENSILGLDTDEGLGLPLPGSLS